LTTDCRIFQGKTVPEIVQTLLNEHGIRHHQLALTGTLPPCEPREFCVQYNETVFDFIHRLLAEEGIFYRFTHEKTHHTLHFCNASSLLPDVGSVKFQLPGTHQTTASVWAVDYTEQRVPTHTVQRDRTFHQPVATLECEYQGLYLNHQRTGYETYRYNGRYKTSAQGQPFTQFFQQQSQNDQRLAHFTHDYLHLQAGLRFKLHDHPVKERNDLWISVAHQLTVEQPQSTEEEAQAHYNYGTPIPTRQASHFECTTGCLPFPQPYSPPAWPKPVIQGPQVADVVGPPGEEIFCDEYGRVVLQFPWDRRAKGDHTSSCWIRVAQNWAGAGWGHVAIPRIGQEVMVDFLEGDPDQPIITGRHYNATHRPPYRLPQHKTRMSIKSKTHQGSGYNELRFEDKTNGEQIYLHGQKDYDIILENDRKEWIRHDRHLRVDNDKYEQVHQDSHQTIGQDKSDRIERHRYFYAGGNFIWQVVGQVHRWIEGGLQLFVKASRATEIGSSDELVIGANQRTAVGNESYTKAKSIVLEANQELTIKAPGGFIKIDTSGIMIKGNIVKINSGGSPGSGTAPKAPSPEQPPVPTLPKDADHRGER
jgi:type VI secretion system secreted protein VgrG